MAYRILSIDGNYLARSRFEASAVVCVGNYLGKIKSLERQFQPSITIVAWDAPKSMLRKNIFSHYKKNRKPANDYFPKIRETMQRQTPKDILQFTCSDGEGDDVLYTITKTMPGPHLVYTADKDMYQLIGNGVDVLKAGSPGNLDNVVDMNNCEIFNNGLTPSLFGDYLTLAGDSVDCIPGLPGIGDKKAREIIEACPQFVKWIIDGRDQEVREFCYQNAQLSKWCELAISRREDLIISKKLTQLYLVELEEV